MCINFQRKSAVLLYRVVKYSKLCACNLFRVNSIGRKCFAIGIFQFKFCIKPDTCDDATPTVLYIQGN